MYTASTILTLSLATALTAAAGIDLTPTSKDYLAEGIKHRQLNFLQDKQHIEYEPPASWDYRGGVDQVYLTPPNKKFAQATINSVQLTKPQALDENIVKLLEQQLVAGLPVGSQFVKIEEEIANPVLFESNPSVEITVSYQLAGEKFLRSALFVNVRDTQLVFRLTARKDDFAALHREFKTSLFSWHWVTADESSSAVAQATPN